jgi:hypothetical protein
MKVNLEKVKKIENKLNEKFQIKSKGEIIRQITNLVRQELPDEVNSCVLEIVNSSTETASFNLEVVVNNELRFELDDDNFAFDMFSDIVTMKIFTPDEIIELFSEFFYGDMIDEEDVLGYPHAYLAYKDDSNVYFFLGGESEYVMQFDILNDLKPMNEFESCIVFVKTEKDGNENE